MFLLSGIYKLIDPSLSMRKLAECPFVGIKNNKLLIIIIIIAGLWEIIASLAVYFGNKRQNVLGIYSLVVFTILATLLCHFPPMGFKYYAFISNITTLGGLLCLAKLIDGCQSEQ
tara:strand:- start:1969 stop:2313 length:345 start_codon:yes stop_codon:yes gene_type:complete